MQESSISEKIKELRTDLKMNQKTFPQLSVYVSQLYPVMKMVWLLPPMMCY